jgi:hypothetical protein
VVTDFSYKLSLHGGKSNSICYDIRTGGNVYMKMCTWSINSEAIIAQPSPSKCHLLNQASDAQFLPLALHVYPQNNP